MLERNTRSLCRFAVMLGLIGPCLLGASRAQSATPDLSAERGLQDHSCLAAVAARAQDWQPTEAWRRVADSSSGAKVYRAPTAEIAVWLEAWFNHDGSARLQRVTPEVVSQLFFAAQDCQTEAKEFRRNLDQARMQAAFNDNSLKEFLAKHPEGALIVSWSPHMPWSYEQIGYSRDLAKKRRLGLAIVMDPHADEAFAHEIARQQKLGDDIFQRIESLELIYRGFTTHYPASITVQEGQFTSGILPGREIPRALERFADKHVPAKPARASSYDLQPMLLAVVALLLSAALFYTYRRTKKI